MKKFLVSLDNEPLLYSRHRPMSYAQLEDSAQRVAVLAAISGAASSPLFTLSTSRLTYGWLSRKVNIEFIAPAFIPGDSERTVLLLFDGQRILLWGHGNDSLKVLQPRLEGSMVFLSLVSLRSNSDTRTLMVTLMADGHLYLIPYHGFEADEASCVKARLSNTPADSGQLFRIAEDRLILCCKSENSLILAELNADLVPIILGECSLLSKTSSYCLHQIGQGKIQIIEFDERIARIHEFHYLDDSSVITCRFELPHQVHQTFPTYDGKIVLVGELTMSVFDTGDSSLVLLMDAPINVHDVVLDKTVLYVLTDDGFSKHSVKHASTLDKAEPVDPLVKPNFIHAFNIMNPFARQIEIASHQALALICERLLASPYAPLVKSWTDVSIIWDGILSSSYSDEARNVALVYTMLVCDGERVDVFCLRHRIPTRIRNEAMLYYLLEENRLDEAHAHIFDLSDVYLFPQLVHEYSYYRFIFALPSMKSSRINLPFATMLKLSDPEAMMEALRNIVRNDVNPSQKPMIRSFPLNNESSSRVILAKVDATPPKLTAMKSDHHPKRSSKLVNIIVPGSSSSLPSTPKETSPEKMDMEEPSNVLSLAQSPLDESLQSLEMSIRHSPRFHSGGTETLERTLYGSRPLANSVSDVIGESSSPLQGISECPEPSLEALAARNKSLLKTPTKSSKSRQDTSDLDVSASPSQVRRSPRKHLGPDSLTPSLESMDVLANVTVRKKRKRSKRPADATVVSIRTSPRKSKRPKENTNA